MARDTRKSLGELQVVMMVMIMWVVVMIVIMVMMVMMLMVVMMTVMMVIMVIRHDIKESMLIAGAKRRRPEGGIFPS